MTAQKLGSRSLLDTILAKYIIFNAMTTSMEAVEFDIIQRSVYHEGVIARINSNLQLLTEISVKSSILSLSVGSRMILRDSRFLECPTDGGRLGHCRLSILLTDSHRPYSVNFDPALSDRLT